MTYPRGNENAPVVAGAVSPEPSPGAGTTPPTIPAAAAAASPVLAELMADAAAHAELVAVPWSAVVVELEADAAALRELLPDLPFFAVTETGWLADLPLGDVLLVGTVPQRFAGTLQAAGRTAYGCHVPPGYDCASDALDALLRNDALRASPSEVMVLWRALVGGATRLPPAAPIDPEHPGMARLMLRARTWSPAEFLALPATAWRVAGLLERGSVAVLGGAPNTGKSTLALGIGLAVATGRPWCGRAVEPGPLLYVGGEGRAGLADRLSAWLAYYGDRPDTLRAVFGDELPPLSVPAGMRDLRELVAQVQQRFGEPPAVVVLDTLSAHWAAPEDESAGLAVAMRELLTLAQETGAAVVLTHHPRKPPAGGEVLSLGAAFRGSTAITANTTAALFLRGEPHALELLTLKQRNAQCAPPLPLALRLVEGERGTAPVVVAADRPAQVVTDDMAARAAAAERMVDAAVAALRELGGATTTRETIYDRMPAAKTTARRVAVATAIDRGLILVGGTARRPTYTLPPE